jgi:hypothetical protein
MSTTLVRISFQLRLNKRTRSCEDGRKNGIKVSLDRKGRKVRKVAQEEEEKEKEKLNIHSSIFTKCLFYNRHLPTC